MDVSVLQNGHEELIEILRATIQREGPITFAHFMDQALYHPDYGYYSSGRASLGRSGDFFTSVSVGPLFGRLLAMQFAEMWETLGRDDDFEIVEQGAQGGEFAHDVLSAAQAEHPEFFAALRYRIVEPFPVLQKRQETALAQFAEKIAWCRSLADMPPFRGVHFSNELLDAFPVHLLRWTGTEWCERHVTERAGVFEFVDRALSDPRIARRLPVAAPAGYETEVDLAALDWIETVAQKISSGYVVTADYGWPREEFFAPQRATGTFRCYAQHRVHDSPFVEIGQTDITAHVEWTSLTECAQDSGFTLAGFTDQHHFLTGLLANAPGEKLVASADAKTKRALQTLLHPQHLGMKFQFLCLTKNVAPGVTLSGLRFARDPAIYMTGR
ncbi:MAG: SAM-dependent methyltransferase [Chthoniobacterales bacterium]